MIATIRHEKVGTKIWQRGKTDVAKRDRQTDTVKRMPVEYARSNQTWSQTYGQTLNLLECHPPGIFTHSFV